MGSPTDLRHQSFAKCSTNLWFVNCVQLADCTSCLSLFTNEHNKWSYATVSQCCVITAWSGTLSFLQKAWTFDSLQFFGRKSTKKLPSLHLTHSTRQSYTHQKPHPFRRFDVQPSSNCCRCAVHSGRYHRQMHPKWLCFPLWLCSHHQFVQLSE